MAVNILTDEDLQHFKKELFEQLRIFIKEEIPAQKKWLKTDEVRKLLQVSPATLQTLRINGTIQYTKLGGILYYDYDHIKKAFEENLRPAR